MLDRVIQQAAAQVLGPLFEAGFSEHSHGYRPGRSAHKAVAVMEESWKETAATRWNATSNRSSTRSTTTA